ncbi:pyruvate dehydrogenase complex dihydrolipoamide acetyltransferase domain protein [Bordetella bronchiseptica]|nr:pyruvate dehydrogenase complex dihydrolipoamide acetyltransferase domain protein [Bordetella bronchiseptica]
MTVPIATLSPTLTLSDCTTPPAEAGISIEALSDSTVIRLCSALMVSPSATSTSMTSTSLKSPISGTLTSIGPAAAGASAWGASAFAASALGASAASGACSALGAAAASPAASTSRMTVPSAILSPTLTLTDFTTPAAEAGISIDALSDSTVIRLCSALIVSPADTSTSMTSTSLKSPMSGTLISTILLMSVYPQA